MPAASPTSERDWRRALAAVHPDAGGADVAAFRQLVDAREVWRKTQPKCCGRCGGPFDPRPASLHQRYCSRHCAVQALAESRRKLRLKTRSHRPNPHAPGRFLWPDRVDVAGTSRRAVSGEYTPLAPARPRSPERTSP